MKKFAISFLCCALILNAAAQTFDPSQDGKHVSCTMILKSGEEKTAVVLNQPAAILKKHYSLLLVQNGGPDVQKSELEGFIINGKVWALRQTPLGDMWCVIDKQGAIDQYTYVTSDGETNGSPVLSGQVTRNRFQPELVTSTEWMLGYKKKMAKMVADYPELAAKVTAGEKGYGMMAMGNVIDEYNQWYEKNNPGKMKYLPGFDPNAKPKTMSVDEAIAAQKAALDVAYAGRTTTPSPEVASAKDNTPVKKETFAAKMARVKADGNRVGVVLDLKPVRANPPERMMSSAMSAPVPVDGSFMDESLAAIGPEFLKELSTALNTTDLELIDLKNIPYRDVKIMGVPGRVDDWWATKYKIVFVLTVDPWIKTVNETFGGEITFNATLNFTTSLVLTEYIGPPTSKEQDILGQVINMGSFFVSYSQKDPNTDLKANYDKLLAKVGMPLIDKARTERAGGVKRVQKKLAD